MIALGKRKRQSTQLAVIKARSLFEPLMSVNTWSVKSYAVSLYFHFFRWSFQLFESHWAILLPERKWSVSFFTLIAQNCCVNDVIKNSFKLFEDFFHTMKVQKTQIFLRWKRDLSYHHSELVLRVDDGGG